MTNAFVVQFKVLNDMMGFISRMNKCLKTSVALKYLRIFGIGLVANIPSS
jgi:hypothetical protein